MIFKRQIPNKIVNILIERYEEEALFLNKNNEYYDYKKLLTSKKKIPINEFLRNISIHHIRNLCSIY